MTPGPKLWKTLLVVLAYVVLVAVWMATNQLLEESAGYTAWVLSLPVASIVFGLVVGRAWALVLAIVPALATAPWWDNGCGGNDVCFGAVVFWVLVPLCALGLGIGSLVRWIGPTMPPAARRAARRAGSTLEERHQVEERHRGPS